MAYKGIVTLEVLGQARNYNRWIADSIAQHLRAPVLEVGSGTGNIAALVDFSPMILSDKDSLIIKKSKRRFATRNNISFCTLDIEKKILKGKRNYFKSIYAVNVLEHVEDDTSALKNMNKMLAKGGILVLLVPANPFAYTRLDKELGHFRRYTRDELSKKIENSGFSVESMKFFNMVGLASWLIRDKFGKNHTDLVSSQVKLFDTIVPVLRFVESVFNVPFGISLVAVAKKK